MRLLLALLLSASCALPAAAALDARAATPPAPQRRPKDVTVHGDARTDDYFWMREKADPAVLAHLKAENAYSDAVLAPTKDLQERLYREMRGRIKEDDVTAPVAKDGWLYYERTEKDKQYPILCRKKGSLDAPEQVMLDLNALAAKEKYLALGDSAVSDDARLLAYSLDRDGHRDYRVYVKDLATGRDLKADVGDASGFVWAADNDTLFYVVEERPSKRSYQLWRYRLSTGRKALVYEEKDALFDVAVGRTLDGRYLTAETASKKTSEVRVLAADRPEGDWRLLYPRETDVRYDVEHRGGLFYIRTNKGAENYRVVTAPVDAPEPARWKDLLAPRPAVKVMSFEPFALHGVAYERENGLPQLRVIDLETGRQTLIPMPEPSYDASPERNPEPKTTTYRFSYESLVTPRSVYAYDMASGTLALLKRTEVLGGFDRSQYRAERLFATAKDGARVPISLVRRADLPPGPRPLLLTGYGSYGASYDVYFSRSRLSLLDRGVVFAIAHIRGGGEFGEPWREAGRMARKMTTFTDFVACGEHLVKTGRTSPALLAAEGGSAGGLLMGAALNLAPSLWRAVVLGVPFVDVLNTMLDASLPLTTSEYIEWGNPEVKDEYAWMRAYSPYDNLAARAYPSTLVNVSLNDSQVPYWEGAKYAAKLRALRTDGNVSLLHAILDAGHSGASGRFDALRDQARDFAFILTELGVEPAPPARR